jgi:hypothetical protein
MEQLFDDIRHDRGEAPLPLPPAPLPAPAPRSHADTVDGVAGAANTFTRRNAAEQKPMPSLRDLSDHVDVCRPSFVTGSLALQGLTDAQRRLLEQELRSSSVY